MPDAPSQLAHPFARLLSPDQAAAYLSLSSRWAIYRLVAAGELPPVRIAGKLRLDREDLDRLIELKKQGTLTRLAPATAAPMPRMGLAPLARPAPRNGDRTVTAASQVRAPTRRDRRTSDTASVARLTVKGR